jgi:sarcosine oxidase subunit gamma
MADIAVRVAQRRSVALALVLDRRVRRLAPMGRFSLRLRPADVGVVGAALGLDLTLPINTATSAGARHALRLGPDEWLVLDAADEGAVPVVLDRIVPRLVYALVDIGHRQVGVALESANAAAMLNALCPLDLSLSAFPIGMATRTVFGKADIVLWRTGAEAFHVEIWRSFAPYVTALLGEIGREYPD